MILFSLKNVVACSMTLVILNSTEFIPSSVKVSPSLRSFDAMCYLKIEKYSLDVNFGLTSWLRDFKISSSSSSIFSSYVFPLLTLLFQLPLALYYFWSVDDLIFVDVTSLLAGERSLSDSLWDWVKFKLFSTSVISSLSLPDISPTYLAGIGFA